ncbi:MAG: thioredoxin domain-containing protein [Alphaproteobacteria bacterium]|nr:thioredoxin domain-containing protein [Alphaproteobacteria bacterium]
MKGFSILLSTVAIIIASVSLVMSTKTSGGKGSVEAALKENPKMVMDAIQAFQDQQRIAQEQAAAESLKKMSDDKNGIFVGPEKAAVTVVEFFDFSCGYCKRLAPAVEKVIADNPDVKFVFKPVSFVSPVSPYQAKASVAAFKQGKFAEFYKGVMEYNGRMTEASVDEIATSIGLDMDKYKKDLNSEEVSSLLAEVSSLSHNIGITGVPALYVNGKQAAAYSAEEIQNVINAAK